MAGMRVKCPCCQSPVVVGDASVTETTEGIDAFGNVAADAHPEPWIEDEPEENQFPDDDIFGGLGDLSQVEATSEDYNDADLYSATPRKKKSKARAVESPSEPEPPDAAASPLLLLGAMFLGGLVISVIVIMLLVSKSGSTPATTVVDEGPAELESRGFADTDEMLGRLSHTLNEMEALLAENRLREFMVRFAPLDKVAQLRQAEIRTTQLPTVPKQRLLQAIKQVKRGKATSLESGWQAEVVFEETVEPGSLTSAPGYGADIDTVLKSAIKDLKEERFEVFFRKILPESAQLQIERNGSERSVLLELEPKSPMVVYMLRDLAAMQRVKPMINNKTAVFMIPQIAHADGFATTIRSLSSHQPEDREIRLSIPGDSWRFHDNLAGVDGVTGKRTHRLQFERVGDSWRLVAWPK